MHDALLAHSSVSGIVVPGIEQMVEPISIPHDAAGADRGIRIGHLPVIEHHSAVLVSHQIVCGVQINRMIALTVMICVVQIVYFQSTVFGHKRHDIADISAFRRGIQPISHRRIRLVREIRVPAAGGKNQQQGKQDRKTMLTSLHSIYLSQAPAREFTPSDEQA